MTNLKEFIASEETQDFIRNTINRGLTDKIDFRDEKYSQVEEALRVNCSECEIFVERNSNGDFECPECGIHLQETEEETITIYRRKFNSKEISELFECINVVESNDISSIELGKTSATFVTSPLFAFEETKLIEEHYETFFIPWEDFRKICGGEISLDELKNRRDNIYAEIIDFEKLSGDDFEEFCKDLLSLKDFEEFESVGTSGSGSDRGRDLIMYKNGRKWVGQCKNRAESGNSVGRNEFDAFNTMASYRSTGYLLLSATDITNPATSDLESIKEDENNDYTTDWLNYHDIESILLDNQELIWKFFVKHRYQSMMLHSIQELQESELTS